MGSSETPLKLPIIDFSKLALTPAGSKEWQTVRTQVHNALEQYGCFEALFVKLPSHIRKSIFQSIEEVFDFPLQTKFQNVAKKSYHGYVGQNPMLPLYESIGFDSEQVQSWTNTLWPEGNPSFCKAIQSFSEQVLELDQIIRTMILESLGLEKYLEDHLESTSYLLRMMKYKGPQTSETKLALLPHTDKTDVTILYQNQVDGLEVQTKDGKWIHVKPSPDSVIVMIGDSLHAWTNGRVHSPCHRVMMSGNDARYSTGLFSVPKEGYIIKTPEEVVDEEHPLLFKPFEFAQFLDFCKSEAGGRVSSHLQAYCGVQDLALFT